MTDALDVVDRLLMRSPLLLYPRSISVVSCTAELFDSPNLRVHRGEWRRV